MSDRTIVPFPSPAPNAEGEAGRQQLLYEWAIRVLTELGLVERIERAASLEQLRKVTFDPDAIEVALAIRAALHPTSGRKDDCFEGLRAGALKRLLNNRFEDMKKDREAELLRGQPAGGSQSTYEWTDELKLDKKGAVRPLLHNLILFLRYHRQWQGVLGFDEFTARVVVRARPPWGDEAPDTPWTDHYETLTRKWFQGEDIDAVLGDVGRAVQAAARHNAFHPVRAYLDALVWDRTPRLDTWLVTYFHTDDTAYARAVGPRFLISAVARIYKPGAKVDHMLVLEGPQGKQKSEALRTLAIKDEWFTDRLSHIGGKDAIMETAGALLIEIAEMDALVRASSSASKGFLTRRHDKYRPPYGKHTINALRQCVFVGSINPPPNGYLKDPTGSRRFWPVLCHGMIDRDGIQRDRNQLWAEAVIRYHEGAKWWLETPELEKLVEAEQAKRFAVDVWKPRITKWIGGRTEVTAAEVLKGALKIDPRNDHGALMRVIEVLKDLGFAKCRQRNGAKRGYCYRRPNPLQEPRTPRTRKARKTRTR